jgi:hypothetical protein
MSAKITNNCHSDKINSGSCECSVHTLEQLRKVEDESLLKRARSKFLTIQNLLPFIDLDSSLHKAYWRTYWCSAVLVQEGNKITGHYCGNRWCLVCNRIRTAKLIEGYLPIIKKEFKDPYLVTLSRPNVASIYLDPEYDILFKALRKIADKWRKSGRGMKALRKLEVTYNNTDSFDYHPHLHILIEGKEAAERLLDDWLYYNKESQPQGQDLRPADENSLIELFKYATKTPAGKNGTEYNTVVLDRIYRSLKGRRIFQPIGIKKADISEEVEEIQVQEIKGEEKVFDHWHWEQGQSDWVNSFGQLRTGCQEYKLHQVPGGGWKKVMQDLEQKSKEAVHPDPDPEVKAKEFLIGEFRDAAIDTFEAGKKDNIKLLRNLNTGQIYDYQKVNIETDVLYMVTDSISVT